MFLHLHSGLRYIVILLGIAGILYALWGLVRRKPYDDRMMSLATWFALSLHVQVISGFALLVSGRFSPALIGHIFMAFMAAAVAQIVSSVTRRKPPEQRTWLPHIIGNVVALALFAGTIIAIGRPVMGGGG